MFVTEETVVCYILLLILVDVEHSVSKYHVCKDINIRKKFLFDVPKCIEL